MPSRTRLKSAAPSPHSRTLFSHILRIIFLLIVLIIIGGIVGAIWLLRWSNLPKMDKNYIIVPGFMDGYKGKILLAHISPQQNQVELLTLPPDLPVRGIQGSYSYGLKILVDDVWTTSDSTLLQNPPNLSHFAQQILFNKLHTNLSLSERVGMYRFLTSLSANQIETHDVINLQDWAKWQTKMAFQEEDKNCSIAVINTTPINGVGGTVANLLEKSGFPVLRVFDTPDQKEQSQILVTQASPFCADVVSHLGGVFPFPVKPEIKPDTLIQYRTNIVIMIGKDLATKLAQP